MITNYRKCSVRTCGNRILDFENYYVKLDLIHYENFSKKSGIIGLVCHDCWKQMHGVLNKIMNLRTVSDD